MATPDADLAAKRFEVPADKARVYVVRASSVGTAILFQVTVDDRIIGSLPVHTFLVADLTPGAHSVTALAGENESSVALSAEAGKAYFLRVGPRPGWIQSRVAIYEIDATEGQRVVNGASLARGRISTSQ
jgi:Protein of unknown function (DUF2846)